MEPSTVSSSSGDRGPLGVPAMALFQPQNTPGRIFSHFSFGFFSVQSCNQVVGLVILLLWGLPWSSEVFVFSNVMKFKRVPKSTFQWYLGRWHGKINTQKKKKKKKDIKTILKLHYIQNLLILKLQIYPHLMSLHVQHIMLLFIKFNIITWQIYIASI